VIIDEFAESVKSTEYTHAQMVISWAYFILLYGRKVGLRYEEGTIDYTDSELQSVLTLLDFLIFLWKVIIN
jgi:hypothetical protein